jgi:hypothetical protein
MQTVTNNLVTRQTELLRDFAHFADALSGTVAMLWLPGLRQRFHGPRAVRGTRPLCVTLEVTPSGGLTLSGAISRPKNGKLRYDVIFKYDFTQPMCDAPAGNVLSAKNEVIANRALGMLQSLIRFGQRRAHQPRRVREDQPAWPVYLVPFNPGEQVYDNARLEALASGIDPAMRELYKEQIKRDLSDSTTFSGTVLVSAAIVPDAIISRALENELGYEDYRPVLGVSHWNPATALREQANPAAAILFKYGVTDLETVDQDTADKLLAEFRAAVALGECLTDEDIYDALVHPEAAVVFSQGVAHADPRRLVTAMRRAAGHSRAAREASDDDLLAAAASTGRLVISALSATQICQAAELHDLLSPYVGGVLPSADWEPNSRRRIAVEA